MKRRRKSASKGPESNGDAAGESPLSAADFSFSLTRVAVSQICRSVGLRAAEFSALETLALIATKYMQCLAGVGVSLSNAANRTESNLFDIVNGLLDLSSSCSRFSGGSTAGDTDARCLIRSGVLRDLSQFVGTAPEIPFAKPVPRRKGGGEISRIPHAQPPPNHVPTWLPSFPDASLYRGIRMKHTPDHLWENSNSVRDGFFSSVETPPAISESEGRSGGELRERREKVRFKLGKKAGPKTRGGACGRGKELERRCYNNGGEEEEEEEEVIVYKRPVVDWPV